MAYLSLQQHTNNPHRGEFIQVLKERYLKENASKNCSILRIKGGTLPEDSIIEILSWLPPKTLIQFKSVSKSWYKIIASPEFISKHIENYYNNNHDMDCFLTLQQFCTQDDKVNLSARLVDEALGINETLRLKPLVPDFELSGGCNGVYHLSGPCNGIYYLSGSEYGNRLWNPTSNEFKVLPPLITRPGLPDFLKYISEDTHGFGYDPLTQDYKVVSIKRYGWNCNFLSLDQRQKQGYPPSVLVYSLKTNSWKYWGDLPQIYNRVHNNNTHIFENGCLYWVAERMEDMFTAIISFNICTDVLQEIQMPNYEMELRSSLGIYNGSIALYTIHDPYYMGLRSFDLWTLNEGVWIKKFSIGHIEPYELDYPVGHLKNNVVIIQNDDGLVLCDLDTESISKVPINGSEFQSIVVYQESLVSIIGLCTNCKPAIGCVDD